MTELGNSYLQQLFTYSWKYHVENYFALYKAKDLISFCNKAICE